MKKSSYKGFIAGFVVCSILSTGLTVFGETSKSIEAVFGRVKLIVNGANINKETLLYNGTTYLPLRDVAEITGLNVNWDGDANVATLTSATAQPKLEKPEIEKPNENTNYSELAAQVIELVNVDRKKEGLSPLSNDSNIEAAAMVRAKELENTFSHTRPDESECFTAMEQAGVKYNSAGENIAYGQGNPTEVMESWMNSPGHRANILKSGFGKIGVGVYEDASGTLYWVQMFTN